MATGLPAEVREAGSPGPSAPELQGFAAALDLLVGTGQLEMLLRHLPGVTDARDTRLHVGYDEAARRLNIPEKWLRERIATLPHRKFGKFVQFADEDLKAISEMHFVRPSGSGAGRRGRETDSVAPLKPSSRSRSRS